jgi:NAD(P)-dependent dehydrogenase (short-subunit alcohol dehydrogenase family)
MSASSSPVALIFGTGKRIGASVAKAFSAKGYNIATVSRTAATDAPTERRFHIQTDLSDPNAVSGVFDTVRKRFGDPSVVIYNGSSLYCSLLPFRMLMENSCEELAHE